MNYKNKANITLLCVFIAFIVVSILKYIYGNLMVIDFLFMVSEASLVGGVADWFAITAIFRKPLGISFHTAIIPRNREKIIDGITSAVENQLLTKEIIEEKISAMDLSSAALHILEENKLIMLNYLEKFLNEYFSGTGKDKLLELSETIKKDQLKRSSLTDLFNLFSKRIYSLGYEEKTVDWVIDVAIKMCRDKKFEALIYKVLMDLKEEKCDNFLSRLSFDFLEKTDSVNLQNAAVNFHQEVIEELVNMKNKDNKFRQILKKEIFQMFLGIEYSRDKIESAKEKIIDSIDVQKIVEQITEVRDGASLLSKFIVKKAQMYFDEITQDNVLKQHLDKVIKYALIKFMVRNHSFIGNLVSETLNNYDDKKLNGFIEDKFGEDLQWIRINGSVVGGIIGGILFVFLKLIFDPFVVPFIRGLVLKV